MWHSTWKCLLKHVHLHALFMHYKVGCEIVSFLILPFAHLKASVLQKLKSSHVSNPSELIKYSYSACCSTWLTNCVFASLMENFWSCISLFNNADNARTLGKHEGLHMRSLFFSLQILIKSKWAWNENALLMVIVVLSSQLSSRASTGNIKEHSSS